MSCSPPQSSETQQYFVLNAGSDSDAMEIGALHGPSGVCEKRAKIWFWPATISWSSIAKRLIAAKYWTESSPMPDDATTGPAVAAALAAVIQVFVAASKRSKPPGCASA